MAGTEWAEATIILLSRTVTTLLGNVKTAAANARAAFSVCPLCTTWRVRFGGRSATPDVCPGFDRTGNDGDAVAKGIQAVAASLTDCG